MIDLWIYNFITYFNRKHAADNDNAADNEYLIDLYYVF